MNWKDEFEPPRFNMNDGPNLTTIFISVMSIVLFGLFLLWKTG